MKFLNKINGLLASPLGKFVGILAILYFLGGSIMVVVVLMSSYLREMEFSWLS